MPNSLFGRLALLLGMAVLVSHAVALRLMFEMGPELFAPAPPGLRHWGLWLDVGVRLAVLMLAAWIGARWLSQPVRRLAHAARELGRDIHRAPLIETGTDECREATRVFNQMQVQMCTLLSERDSFVAAVSHDLRTPLTRMALRAESLSDAEQRLRFGCDIAEMNNMITATLDYLRGVAAAESFVLLDIDSMLHSLADDCSAGGYAVKVVCSAQLRPCAPLRTQAQALRRCISNIVDNAVRYGGAASVSCFDVGDHLCIEVRDNGPGMAKADLVKVLAPFYRVERSSHCHSGGVGLGLSIASDIAGRLQGEVRLENGDLGGLVVTVALRRTG